MKLEQGLQRKHYIVLREKLSEIISETASGEKLPSEPVLAKSLGVSRATLREAMRFFEGNGLIRRKQGVGTFVLGTPQVFEAGLEVLESIDKIGKRSGMDVRVDGLSVNIIPANEQMAKEFSVEIGANLLKIERTVITENRTIAYLEDIVPNEFLSLNEFDFPGFSGSVLDYLLKKGNPVPSRSFTSINAEPANSNVARALGIQRGDGLLVFTAKLYSEKGRVVDYSSSYFLPGYFHFHVVRSVGVS
ncbi:MAG: GntR family transcriptional regulator [Anaerolineaceae bacterium]|nr:GntR family transcriptional regulator [Anaerolineaceae bacterium]